MELFLKWLDEMSDNYSSMHVEIGHNKTCEWNIYIYMKDCARKYPHSKTSGQNAIICNIQSGDVELAFAKAQCEVKEWFLDNLGGY